MRYNNLDKLYMRAQTFNNMGADIYNKREYLITEQEAIIIKNSRLIKILKIAKVLKNTDKYYLDFNEIKNIDPNFICDGDKLVVKFDGSPIELRLTLNSREDRLKIELANVYNYYCDGLYKLYNFTLDNIINFEQKFIKKINNIFVKQDDDFIDLGC